ncbi:hypothetical protein DFH06DRAFT_68015 [Mycena polygramma]|nr:hypothetical protein DFH06DRAFT_68015 [Mycena polygramma]
MKQKQMNKREKTRTPPSSSLPLPLDTLTTSSLSPRTSSSSSSSSVPESESLSESSRSCCTDAGCFGAVHPLTNGPCTTLSFPSPSFPPSEAAPAPGVDATLPPFEFEFPESDVGVCAAHTARCALRINTARCRLCLLGVRATAAVLVGGVPLTRILPARARPVGLGLGLGAVKGVKC